MQVALFGKALQKENYNYLQNLVDSLHAVNAKLFFENEFFQIVKNEIKFKSIPEIYTSHTDLKNVADYLISIGGDGTFLETIRFVRDSNIPVIGINTGRLGFLSSISKESINEAIKAISEKKYTLDQRTLLTLETSQNLFGDLNYALNELTIVKKDSSSMITIHSYLDNAFLNSYWADGLIVSTPTGSTAYSLSCGGPILTPESENFIITPIAPHNLNVRPIVLPDKHTISLKVEGRSNQFLISLDSRSETISSSTELIVKKADFKINLIRLHDHDFLPTLRNKLMWGLDKRN